MSIKNIQDLQRLKELKTKYEKNAGIQIQIDKLKAQLDVLDYYFEII